MTKKDPDLANKSRAVSSPAKKDGSVLSVILLMLFYLFLIALGIVGLSVVALFVVCMV